MPKIKLKKKTKKTAPKKIQKIKTTKKTIKKKAKKKKIPLGQKSLLRAIIDFFTED